MAQPVHDGCSNPDDVRVHQKVKEVADMLRPELLRLHKVPMESSGDIELYRRCIEQIEVVKREVTNHDALFAFHNVISHIKNAIKLSKDKADNQKILWSLQEVTAILFKVQSLPS